MRCVSSICNIITGCANHYLWILLGIPGLRAGMIIPVRIGAVDGLAVSRLMIAEKVTHTFEGDEHDHTMSIEVKDFGQLGGINIV